MKSDLHTANLRRHTMVKPFELFETSNLFSKHYDWKLADLVK